MHKAEHDLNAIMYAVIVNWLVFKHTEYISEINVQNPTPWLLQ